MTEPTPPTIAVIGLGYVGLPLAVEFGKKYPTLGLDLSADKIDACQHFIDPTGEVSGDSLRAERVNPGDKERTLTKIRKVVSGDTRKTLDLVDKMYASVITTSVYRASSIMVAEAAKVIENTQREGVVRVVDKPASASPDYDPLNADPASSSALPRVNVGNNQPMPLTAYIEAIETALDLIAVRNYLPMQPGDVPATSADTSELDGWVGFKPNTAVPDGVTRFVEWYRRYYAS